MSLNKSKSISNKFFIIVLGFFVIFSFFIPRVVKAQNKNYYWFIGKNTQEKEYVVLPQVGLIDEGINARAFLTTQDCKDAIVAYLGDSNTQVVVNNCDGVTSIPILTVGWWYIYETGGSISLTKGPFESENKCKESFDAVKTSSFYKNVIQECLDSATKPSEPVLTKTITLSPQTTPGAKAGDWCANLLKDGSGCAEGATTYATEEDCQKDPKNTGKTCRQFYTLLAPIPGFGSQFETTGGPEGIVKYVNTVVKFAIGIAGLLAVIMIVIGGFQYMLSDMVFVKKEAIGRIQGAVGGLVLALMAFLILEILDPKILNIGLKLPRANLENLPGVATGTDKNPVWTKSCPKPENWGNETCENCSSLKEVGINVKNNDQVNSKLKDLLSKLKKETDKKSIEWTITEAWSPTVKRHCANCHYVGTCVDLAIRTNLDGASVKSIIETATTLNFGKIQYEVNSKERKTTLVEQGAPADYILPLEGHITAEHFSVYLNK